jgi:hypothetical protein
MSEIYGFDAFSPKEMLRNWSVGFRTGCPADPMIMPP